MKRCARRKKRAHEQWLSLGKEFGTYVASNVAIDIHWREQAVFLDADDDIADGFIDKRQKMTTALQADVVLFDGWHWSSGADQHQREF